MHQQAKVNSLVDLALHTVQAGDLPFGLAISPRRTPGGLDGSVILSYHPCELLELRYAASFRWGQPRVQALPLSSAHDLPHHLVQAVDALKFVVGIDNVRMVELLVGPEIACGAQHQFVS